MHIVLWKMFVTILIGFFITILFFGCYVKSNFRTRNYRISLWHYLMASNEKAEKSPEATPGQVDTCKSPQSDTDIVEPMSPSTPISETKEGQMECDTPSNPISPEPKLSPDTIITQKGTETKPEVPQNNENVANMELDNPTPEDVSKTDETIEDKDSEVISKPIDSPTGTETGTGTDPLSVPDADTNDPPEKDQDDGEGEWTTDSKPNKKKPKGNKKVSGASKGATKETVMESPTHGLRNTKERQQKKWKEFVNSLSKQTQKLMGGSWATEDTERYVN